MATKEGKTSAQIATDLERELDDYRIETRAMRYGIRLGMIFILKPDEYARWIVFDNNGGKKPSEDSVKEQKQRLQEQQERAIAQGEDGIYRVVDKIIMAQLAADAERYYKGEPTHVWRLSGRQKPFDPRAGISYAWLRDHVVDELGKIFANSPTQVDFGEFITWQRIRVRLNAIQEMSDEEASEWLA